MPWTDTSINGWILDPDRKKMSKSKGNVVTPIGVLEKFGSDAVRYWALNGRPGVDTALDEGQMKVGRRLAIKVLNASKFVLGVMGEAVADPDLITTPIDRALWADLGALVDDATAAFDAYDYARALERTERFFWSFCDDYLELVKTRAYGTDELDPAGAASARATLALTLDALQRLFAPHLPFVTEEVWSWWREGSVHRAAWPEIPGATSTADCSVYRVAAEVLGAVRKAKSDAQRSLRTEVVRAVVRDTPERLAALALAVDDVRESGRIQELVTEIGRLARDRRRARASRREAGLTRVDTHDARAWLDAHMNLETGVGVPVTSSPTPSRRATAPTLDRISALVELLGSPQLSYPVVHVTGTNGKTSVARMTASLLAATGLSVGSFTSPHLARVNERISWNGEPILDAELDALLALVAELEPDARRAGPRSAQLVRDPDRGRAHLVRRHRGRRRGRRGRPRRHVGLHQRGRRDRRGRDQREHRPRRVPRYRRGPTSRRRRPGSSAPGPRSCSARPIPSCSRSSRPVIPNGSCSASATSQSSPTASHTEDGSSTSVPRARATTSCSCRCTARTRR